MSSPCWPALMPECGGQSARWECALAPGGMGDTLVWLLLPHGQAACDLPERQLPRGSAHLHQASRVIRCHEDDSLMLSLTEGPVPTLLPCGSSRVGKADGGTPCLIGHECTVHMPEAGKQWGAETAVMVHTQREQQGVRCMPRKVKFCSQSLWLLLCSDRIPGCAPTTPVAVCGRLGSPAGSLMHWSCEGRQPLGTCCTPQPDGWCLGECGP